MPRRGLQLIQRLQDTTQQPTETPPGKRSVLGRPIRPLKLIVAVRNLGPLVQSELNNAMRIDRSKGDLKKTRDTIITVLSELEPSSAENSSALLNREGGDPHTGRRGQGGGGRGTTRKRRARRRTWPRRRLWPRQRHWRTQRRSESRQSCMDSRRRLLQSRGFREAAKEAIHQSGMAKEYGVAGEQSIDLFMDNESGIKVAYNPEHFGRMKHVDIQEAKRWRNTRCVFLTSPQVTIWPTS